MLRFEQSRLGLCRFWRAVGCGFYTNRVLMLMFVFKTPIEVFIPTALLACIIVRWLVNNLLTLHDPKFRDLLTIPLLSSVKKEKYRETFVEVVAFAGVVWIARYNPPWEFFISTSLFLCCLTCLALDYNHRVVSDAVTTLGVVLGIALSAAYPAWQREVYHLNAAWDSILGAATGAGVIFFMIEAGKFAFGKQVKDITPPSPFAFEYAEDGNHSLVADGERMKWADIFTRGSDILEITCQGLKVGFPEKTGEILKLSKKSLQIDNGEREDIDQHTEFSGSASRLVVPREAMGDGDATFMAMVGAFTGFSGVLVVFFCGILIGALLGIITKATGRGNTIPFVPPLALGVLCWARDGEAIKHLILHH